MIRVKLQEHMSVLLLQDWNTIYMEVAYDRLDCNAHVTVAMSKEQAQDLVDALVFEIDRQFVGKGVK